MLSFACPGCGHALKVKEELAGKKGKCPGCGCPVVVPAAVHGVAPVRGTETPTVAPLGLPPGPVQPRHDTRCDGDSASGAPALVQPAGELTDFLAPARGGGEIGWLGPYRVLKVLGAGGMGVVFQAEDPALGRLVAIKAMLPSMAASASGRERFLREAKAAATIEHDNIVAIYMVGEERGIPFLAMPFLKGEPLDVRLEREKRLAPAEVLRIARETASGLAAAHRHGLIHRDIKPANLWLEAQQDQPPASATGGRVKILDFGLARAAGSEAQLTQQGAIVGTPAFMAPEQAQGKPVDGRSDLFSLGCVMYHMATGELPFRGADTISTLVAVATQEPQPPHALNGDLPQAVSELVMGLLVKEPAHRPASAQELIDAIRAIEEAPTVELVPEVTPVQPRSKPARQRSTARAPGQARKGNGKLALGVTAAILAVAGLGAGGYFLFHRSHVPEQPGPDSHPTVALTTRPATPTTTPAPPRDPRPWQPLFNGNDLAGWKVVGGKADNWGTDLGTIFTQGKDRGWLITDKEFANFELRLEYRLSLRGNSGVALRAPDEGDPAFTGMEIQLIDDARYKLKPTESTGSIFGVAAAVRAGLHPPGEWYKLHISARGRRIVIDHGGKTILTANLDAYKDQAGRHPGLLRDRGRIGLQSHTGRAEFRNLEVRPLPAPKDEHKSEKLDHKTP